MLIVVKSGCGDFLNLSLKFFLNGREMYTGNRCGKYILEDIKTILLLTVSENEKTDQ